MYGSKSTCQHSGKEPHPAILQASAQLHHCTTYNTATSLAPCSGWSCQCRPARRGATPHSACAACGSPHCCASCCCPASSAHPRLQRCVRQVNSAARCVCFAQAPQSLWQSIQRAAVRTWSRRVQVGITQLLPVLQRLCRLRDLLSGILEGQGATHAHQQMGSEAKPAAAAVGASGGGSGGGAPAVKLRPSGRPHLPSE